MKSIEPPVMYKIANAGTKLNAVRRICVYFLTVLSVAAIVPVQNAFAQNEDVYTVSGVSVDETAETASAARESAIAIGHRKAFDRLVARIVPARQRAALPVLKQAEIVPLVLSFEIEEEKRSTVRYLGTLKFRFRRLDVRRFLQQNNANLAETRSKPVLLLPVYEFAGAKLLWDEPNPWFAAWNAVPPSDGLVPLRLPAGDLADIRDISAEQAAAGSEEQLAIVAERYGASTVLVATASVNADSASGTRSLTVSTRYFGGTSANRTSVSSFEYGGTDTDETVIGRAARQVAVQVEEDWKQENLIRFDSLNSLVADIEISELRQWVEMRRRLGKIAFLQRWQLLSVSRRNATVRLNYYGDAEQLRIALAQRDLILEQGAVNWSLRELRDTRAKTDPDEPLPEMKPASPVAAPASDEPVTGAPADGATR